MNTDYDMPCPLEKTPTFVEKVYSALSYFILWVLLSALLTLISYKMGVPLTLSQLLFIYIALFLSDALPKIHLWLKRNYYWNKWEKLRKK